MIFQHNTEPGELALYIHWPFCLAKCPYCDFNSHVAAKIDEGLWLESYLKELSFFKETLANKNITSIFFGGGTPSLMPPVIVEKIIGYLSKNSHLAADIEVTLEANPTSVEANKFAGFKAAGVNRLSLGIQSLNDGDLKALGRQHNAKEAIEAIKLASKYFTNYSFDLIYARAEQELKPWQIELEQALELAGTHLSLYQLTIEKGTPFYKLHKDGALILPEGAAAAEMYDYTNRRLIKADFNRYEISNYAKAGFASRHNIAYWEYKNYLGIGPGAHSRLKAGKQTYAIMMSNKPNKWLDEVRENNHAIQIYDALTPTEHIHEMIMMGLRLTKGLSDTRLKELTGYSLAELSNSSYYDMLIDNRILNKNKDYHYLSEMGLTLHNYLIPRLIKNLE